MSLFKVKGGRIALFTVAVYDVHFNIVKILRTAISHEKADYYCRYYEARLKLGYNQFVGYDY